MRFRLLCAVLAACLIPQQAAFSQGAIIQAGPATQAHAPAYLQGGSTTVVSDSGAASGGASNLGLSELLLQERGVGTPPYANAGTGPLFTNFCDYDGPPFGVGGAHYICLGPNSNGAMVLAAGATGSAPQIPFEICVNNNACLQIPFGGAGSGNVVGVPPTTIGGATCFENTIATLIGACNPSTPGGPAIAAVTPTVVDAPVCWDNTFGTLLITCPGSGPGGDWQVNTTNGSGVAGFTSFLNLPQSPSFSTSPTGNPTGGGILATLSTIDVQAAAESATQREFLVNLGLTSNTGSGASGSNADKVTLYAGAVGSAGTGALWATNFLTSRTTGSGSYNLQTEECDQNNFGVDTGGSDGPAGLPTFVSYCITASGVSDANGYTNTAGIAIISDGGVSGNVPLDAHGLIFTGHYKFNDIADYAVSPTYEAVYGAHTYGVDFMLAGLSGGAVRIGTNSTAGIVGRDSAGTADAQLLTWTGTNELICQTNCALVNSNAQIQAPTFTASIGMTIASLPVPTGVGIANTCALWTTTGNLGTTACAAATADGTTIINTAGVLSAVTGPTPQAVSASSSTTTIAPAATSEAVVTLTSSTTITLSPPSPSTDTRLFKLRLIQDGTGSRAVTFDSSVIFGTTVTSFTASTAANATDEVGFEWNATKSKWMLLAYALGF